MTINWFPGHMNKARRELAETLRRTDVVIEVLDARLPQSSRNPMLAELRQDTPALVLLNKADLADPDITAQWVEAFSARHRAQARPLNAGEARETKSIPGLCKSLVPHRRGPGKEVRCLVVGIPNVGKSTLINSLLGRRVNAVGDRPAVTKHQKRFHLDQGVSLADTPGVLWPKLADQEGAYRLAASGAVRETAFMMEEVAAFAAGFLAERYPEALMERYRLDTLPEESLAILEAVGRKRGFLQRGNQIDLERSSEVLLRELRGGQLGRVSFETPDDFEENTG